jgi:hypothetical protein
LAALLIFAVASAPAPSVAGEPPRRPRRVHLRLDSEVEYYLPTKSDRRIDSVFTNAVFGVSVLRDILIVEAGMTATTAWGHITQLGDDFQPVRLSIDGAVFGSGPILLVRCQPFHIGRFSLLLDVLGGIVFYSSHFPPGGDFYNFTWRLGGAFAVRVSEHLSVTAGARWMHVSNGQGFTQKNPSYEGVGFPVGLAYRF